MENHKFFKSLFVITGVFCIALFIIIGSFSGTDKDKINNYQVADKLQIISDNDTVNLHEEDDNGGLPSDDSEIAIEESTAVENTDIEIASNADEIPLSIIIQKASASDKLGKRVKKKLKYSDIPEYSGLPIVEVHNDKPFFRKKDKKAFKTGTEYYSPLDELGRCGVAYACIGTETIPDEDEERGEIGQIRPSGWHTVKYADIIPDLYLYNRCHLIGWQLGAENSNECNLITGTRSMNVSGMLPYENMIADYVRRSGNHVMYRVTPYFVGDELVARGVLMEAQSIETTDISFCVWCYNVQPGIIIDYETGDSSVDEHYIVQVTDGNEGYGKSGDTSDSSGTNNNLSSGTSPGMGEDKDIASETTYVLNTNTHKFHYVDCPSVKQMATHNMEQTTMTRDEIIAAGYSPCGNCKP